MRLGRCFGDEAGNRFGAESILEEGWSNTQHAPPQCGLLTWAEAV